MKRLEQACVVGFICGMVAAAMFGWGAAVPAAFVGGAVGLILG